MKKGAGWWGFPLVIDSHHPDALFSRKNDRKLPCWGCACFVRRVGARVEVRGNAPAAIAFRAQKEGNACQRPRAQSSDEWWTGRYAWQREEWGVELTIHGGKSAYRIFRDVTVRRVVCAGDVRQKIRELTTEGREEVFAADLRRKAQIGKRKTKR